MDPWLLVRLILGVALSLATLPVLLSKCFFLAPCRLGWLMMIANTVYEAFFKKLRLERRHVDAAALLLLPPLWAVVGGPWAGLVAALLIGLSWAWTLAIDLRWRGGAMARQDRRYSDTIPLPLPRLILMVRGPILDRGRINRLGDWPVGHEEQFEVLVLNPSIVRPQLPMKLEIAGGGDAVEVAEAPRGERQAPEPGELVRLNFRLRAARAGGACELLVKLTHGDYVATERLHVRSVFPAEQATVRTAEIRRWKGGCRAAFGWRGDHDKYDPSTFQDAEGLRTALGLSRRFQMPSTVYLSARLSLVPEEHRKFCEHFGFDRRTEEIPEFIRFLRQEVHVQAEMEFPFQADRPYYAEIGNHMYLHYGTHSACDEGNHWKMRATIGDGQYPWQSAEKDPFHEQRDNAAKCNQVFQEVLGFLPTSFAVPGRDYSQETAAAVEAAGIRVGSDTDASQWHNVMGLPRPHHPKGVQRLVDVTKKYPGDCDNAYKIAVLKYWMHAARRAGSHFLYMAHQHLLRYCDNACYHLTEEMLRYVLGDCHGDFYPATVSAIGLYWERVLCPDHRAVAISAEGESVTVENTGDADLDRLPLEIELSGGRRFMSLVDVPAGGRISVPAAAKG